MMSGHGANPIFFNKKNKDWTSRTVANPPPPYVRYYLNFTLPPLSTPPQSGRHNVYHPLLRITFYQRWISQFGDCHNFSA